MSYIGTSPQFASMKVGNVEIEGNVVYLGDKSTDGTFRIIQDGADFKIEVRTSGSWVAKDIIDGPVFTGPISTTLFDPLLTRANITLTDGNSTAQITSDFSQKSMAFLDTDVLNSGGGKFYTEFDVLSTASGFDLGCVAGDFGIGALESITPFVISGGTIPSAYIQNIGNIVVNGAPLDTVSALAVNDKVSIAIDVDNDLFWVAVNGVWSDGDPASGAGGYAYPISGRVNTHFGIEFTANQNGGQVKFLPSPNTVITGFTYLGE